MLSALASYRALRPSFDLPGVKSVNGSLRLANGDRIQPVGRVHIRLKGDLPLAFSASPDGSSCYVVTGGYHDHGLTQIDLGDERNVNFSPTKKCAAGLVSSSDGSYYVAAGDLGIRRFVPSSDKENWSSVPVTLTSHGWIQGLVALSDGTLVASDVNNDHLIAVNPKTGETLWTVSVGHHPHRVAKNPAGHSVAVANWGGSSVSLVDTTTRKVTNVAVGAQPSDVLFSADGTLYVANSGSNSVSIIRGGEVVGTVFTSLVPNDLVGSSPNGLALSPKGDRLYVPNGGSNTVAIVDVADPSKPKIAGFLPTGWYPTAVFATSDGKRLLVATAKGMSSRPNWPGREVEQELTDDMRNQYDYLPNTLTGDVSVVDLPNSEDLVKLTAECQTVAKRQMGLAAVQREAAMLPTLQKIKHVVYIIRESRSYDQVLGDLKGTMAEPNLCMYGERVTPNGHKIAKTWQVLDNLYCDGEVSQDGHQWCNAAYCTDFTEKVWPTGYADRGRPEEDESVAGSPAGYLWDNCAKHGLTYRSYGEFAGFKANKNSAPVFEGPKTLEGHTSEKWSLTGGRDMDRVSIFIDEMRNAETAGDWPNFMVMSLGEDHTSGRDPGQFTPFAKVASNDLGLGRLVDAVSHSKFWKDTAIFVIEDDAQDGPDHIDGHRTVGYFISPYVKRGGVDHTMYCTSSMIRTMELMLGLPPMTQHDRDATSMVASFTDHPDFTPFSAESARIDLMARNPEHGKLAEMSQKLDFSEFDRTDPKILNRILWEDAKPGVPYPTRLGR